MFNAQLLKQDPNWERYQKALKAGEKVRVIETFLHERRVFYKGNTSAVGAEALTDDNPLFNNSEWNRDGKDKRNNIVDSDGKLPKNSFFTAYGIQAVVDLDDLSLIKRVNRLAFVEIVDTNKALRFKEYLGNIPRGGGAVGSAAYALDNSSATDQEKVFEHFQNSVPIPGAARQLAIPLDFGDQKTLGISLKFDSKMDEETNQVYTDLNSNTGRKEVTIRFNGLLYIFE